MFSVLEIILYSIIGLAVTLYIARGIYVIIDRKKHPDKYKEKDKKEEEKLDE